MIEDLGNRLDEELSWQNRQPVDAVVTRALTHGRHVRRVRRAGAKAGAVTVVGMAVVAVMIGSQIEGTSTRQSAEAGAPAVLVPTVAVAVPHHDMTARATPGTVGAKTKSASVVESAANKTTAVAPAAPAPHPLTSHPAGVPATTRGALQLLTEQLGTLGSTSHAGVASDGSLHVELYLTGEQGTGMVRVSLDSSGTPVGCPQPDPAFGFAPTCTTDAAGDLVATWSTPGNCIQNQSVMVAHPDGSVVSFDLVSRY